MESYCVIKFQWSLTQMASLVSWGSWSVFLAHLWETFRAACHSLKSFSELFQDCHVCLRLCRKEAEMSALQRSYIREVKAWLPQRTTVGPSRVQQALRSKAQRLFCSFKISCLDCPVQKFQPWSSQCDGERKTLDKKGHLWQAGERSQALWKGLQGPNVGSTALCVAAGQTLLSLQLCP